MSSYNKTAVLQKPGKCLRPDHITLRMRKAPSLTRSGMLPKEDAHREWLQQIQQSFQRSGLKRRVARHELVDLADTHVDQNASLRLYGYAECLMYTLNVNVKSPGVRKNAEVGLTQISGKADVLHSGRPTRWIASPYAASTAISKVQQLLLHKGQTSASSFANWYIFMKSAHRHIRGWMASPDCICCRSPVLISYYQQQVISIWKQTLLIVTSK